MTSTLEPVAPVLTWSVPGLDSGQTVDLAAWPGRAVVLVGANGAGKSALAYWMSVNPANTAMPVTRVVAHRRIWLRSSGTDITSADRQNMDNNHRSWDSTARSRVYIEGDEQRASKLIFDLLARVSFRNSQIAEVVDSGNGDFSSVADSLLRVIGRIFAAAHLEMTFQVTQSGTIDAVRDGSLYPLSDMSDGEKGAFILAAEVLLARPGGVLIVDEPERHLHRAISADFISALMGERPDSAFVFMTHDLDLISRLTPSKITIGLVDAVTWDSNGPTGWDLKIDPATSAEVPEAARRAILGGRKKILFVEGESRGVDAALFEVLYPEWSVVPCGGWEAVCRATEGLTRSSSYHWVLAHGILDGDARTDDQITALADKGITVLPVNEVESLYYLSCVVEVVSAEQAKAFGEDPAGLKAKATDAALDSLKQQNVDHLASANAEKVIRQTALAHLPTREQIREGAVAINLSMESSYPSQRERLINLLSARDYDAIVRRFSVRDSGFLGCVAEALKYPDRTTYQARVRVLLAENSELRQQVRNTVGWDGKVPSETASP
jgi:ABC-type molybdenum transport system ATPase subunit/photorepair protein PhrA